MKNKTNFPHLWVNVPASENRQDTQETERFQAFSYQDLMPRDQVNLEIFWLIDESLEDSDNLEVPDVLALEIAKDLEAVLDLFQSITENLEAKTVSEV